ncbi:tetratricopeptide repeat protein [Pseudomonadota bacterium]
MSLYHEIKRRNLFRVAVAYLAGAWLLTQVADTLFPAFGIPDWGVRFVVIVIALGFVPAMIISWAYELTPEGLKREKDVVRDASVTHFTAKRLDGITIGLIVLALAFLVVDRLWLSPRLAEQLAVPAESETDIVQISEPELLYPPNSIAVLPFANISQLEENAPFTTGIHDDLLTQLAKISTLKVISRTSVLQYRGTTKTAPQIAAELGVAAILEGGIQRYGDKVRINVQLVDAQSDEHLWAETYDRDLTTRNVYAIQTEIAESITSALNSALSLEDRERLDKVPTESLDAYHAYLLGKQRMINRTSASLKQAADYFQTAVELDPGYALAYVGLADTYMLLGDYSNLSLGEMQTLAVPALQSALRLDDRLAEAYTSMGAISSKSGDYVAAENAFKRAINLDPNYATAYHWYGDLLVTYLGRPEGAIPLLQKALALDPLSPALTITLGQALEQLGRFDEAMAQYLKVIEIEPSYASPYFLIAGLYRSAYGQIDEAILWRFRGMARDPGMVLGLSMTGLYYLDLGDDAEAEYWINRAVALAPEQAASNTALAFLYRYRNDRERALQVARKLLEIVPGNNTSLVTLVNFGRHREALKKFAQIYPELQCDDQLSVTRFNVILAINLSLALEETGDSDCAALLLNKVIARLKTLPRLGSTGYGIADVEAYARLGKRDEAIASLRHAIDNRYRAFWWAQGEKSAHMLSLREDPEFTAMMQELKADMALQLARVREMRANGELPDIPLPQS